METAFSPLQSGVGGLLIGAAAVLLMMTLGRIAGATGVLTGTIFGPDRGWRLAFLAGMIAGPAVFALATGSWPIIQVPVETATLLVGGVLVGIGVTLGGGCTSGHGVCGLARFSARSLAATLTFMATTALTVYVVRHLAGG